MATRWNKKVSNQSLVKRDETLPAPVRQANPLKVCPEKVKRLLAGGESK